MLISNFRVYNINIFFILKLLNILFIKHIIITQLILVIISIISIVIISIYCRIVKPTYFLFMHFLLNLLRENSNNKWYIPTGNFCKDSLTLHKDPMRSIVGHILRSF